MKTLIVGAGVAGPTLAFWLARHGYRSTLIEKAPAPRRGGYVIDFWGAAFDIAERMAIVPDLERVGYHLRELRIVDRRGHRCGGFDASVFGRLTDGRYLSLPRSALAAAIAARLDDQTEQRFGQDVRVIEQDGDGATVQFADGSSDRYDLVVGADGLHSRVRELVFGPEREFEVFLGYEVAAFEVDGYRPRDDDVYVVHTEKGRQLARFALRGDRTMFLMVWAVEGDGTALPHDLAGQRAHVREHIGGVGWEAAAMLDAMERADEIYLDRVSQIRMPEWTRGRVALVGDAAHCASLLAGQGSALAMIGTYVLAGELHGARGDVATALGRYHERLGDFMARKQHAAVGFAGAFAPKTRLGVFVRNQVTKLLGVPLIAELALSSGLRDAIELPHYESVQGAHAG